MDISGLIERHYSALKARDFKGYDPYDGLGSRLFRSTPCFRSRAMRLAWIQLFKRSPVNLRSIALVPEGRNAKGLALIIQGLLKLYRAAGAEAYLGDAYRLADMIVSQGASGRPYFCAGYDFFWEAKAFSVPEFTPNMIVSSFAGQAFLDLYDIDGDSRWLDLALGIGEFFERELVLFETDQEMAFGYVPGEDTRVHNVNLMGARLFARLFSSTGEERHRDRAVKAARYSVGAQGEDGAWAYGENPDYQWVDNFHTGFNLVALRDIDRYLPDDMWKRSIDSGLKFHMENHFLEDITPKYYDNGTYPIDIHNFAQGIDTFLTFGRADKARALIDRCIEIMWDERRKYFYYQKTRWYTNRIDYMRWSQAWMFYALARYQAEIERGEGIASGETGNESG
jgi:hypothetical protein